MTGDGSTGPGFVRRGPLFRLLLRADHMEIWCCRQPWRFVRALIGVRGDESRSWKDAVARTSGRAAGSLWQGRSSACSRIVSELVRFARRRRIRELFVRRRIRPVKSCERTLGRIRPDRRRTRLFLFISALSCTFNEASRRLGTNTPVIQRQAAPCSNLHEPKCRPARQNERPARARRENRFVS